MQKITILIFISAFLGTVTSGQSVQQTHAMSEASVRPYVFHFTNDNHQLSGPGAELIRRSIAASQFFAFGEYHGSHQLTTLCQTLLGEASKEGYAHFAVEVGPHSAQVLKRLSKDPDQTSRQLHAFNSKYYLPEDEDIPIPFFDGKEDATLLAEASRQGYELWGLDQEYFTSAFFLFDEIVELAKEDAELKQWRVKAEPILRRLYRKDTEEKRFPLYDSLQNEPTLRQFLSRAEKVNQECAQIVKDLRISWDIYERNRQYSRSSHLKRIKYMRQNFLNNYQRQSEALPKVFVKMGGLHTSKAIQLGAYDIGDLTESLARENGTLSTSTGCTYRFEETEDGTIKDYWAERKDQLVTFSFQMFGKKDQWTVIDLKAIKAKVEAGELLFPTDYTYHTVRAQLANYDLFFIPPLDQETEPNYAK